MTTRTINQNEKETGQKAAGKTAGRKKVTAQANKEAHRKQNRRLERFAKLGKATSTTPTARINVDFPVITSGIKRLRDLLTLPRKTFARLMSVSERSLASLEGGASPSETVTRRSHELQRLVDALAEVIQPEAIGPWLMAPNEAFDSLKPIEVIERGESDRIWQMVFLLRSGTGF